MAPEIQYVDFAQWQRDRLSGGLLEEQLGYWRKVLAGDPPSIDLPADRPRPVEQSHRGAWESRALSPDIAAGVRQMAGRASATPFMIFLAAFNALLSRYTGHEDILIGSPIAGRSAPFAESLLGCFLNMLVMRTDLSGNPNFETLIARVRESALGAYAHADIPFELLVADLRPHRDLSRSPFFQVSLALQSAPKSAEMSDDVVDGRELGIAVRPDVVRRREQRIVHGNRGIQRRPLRRRNHRAVARPLRNAARLRPWRTPKRRSARCRCCPPKKSGMLLREWNDTAATGELRRMSHRARRGAGEGYARCPRGFRPRDCSWNYSQLNRRANQLAHFLREPGAGPETLVGLSLERSADMVVALLGILKAGAAYVPLDPSFPKERLAFMLRDAGVSVLVTETELAHLGAECSRVVRLDAEWPEIARQPDTNPAPAVGGEALAYVMYTSGSTGHSEGRAGSTARAGQFPRGHARQAGVQRAATSSRR